MILSRRERNGAVPQRGRLRRLAAAASLLSLLAASPGVAVHKEPVLVAIEATPMQASRLLSSFDLAEARYGTEVHAVLWPGDAARLDATGLEWRILDRDLMDEHARALLPDPSVLSTQPSTEEPRTTYRVLDEHHQELRDLAAEHPDLVELIQLGSSLEGRPIIGVRIAIGDSGDGRPQAYLDGVHHAREWPSGEYVTGFAHRLVSDALAGEPRVTDLLQRVAVVLVPVINPDGFNISRSTPADGSETVLAAVGLGAYWRKNARGIFHSKHLHASVGSYGVDPNRNYPFKWGSGTLTGGNGASGLPADQTYEGTAPASEPEVAAARRFVLTNNITALITNHTYGRLVLYPWGHTRDPAPDVAVLKPLAEHIAAANLYTPQIGLDLYATTGTMDDWAYAATGTLGFTLEHGTSFHPTYGLTALRRGINEEAFLRLVEAAADPSKHSVVRGRVVDQQGRGVQATLRLSKLATINRYSGFTDEPIDLELRTAADGSFEWHINPSRGPIDHDPYSMQVLSTSGTALRTVFANRGQDVSLGSIVVS